MPLKCSTKAGGTPFAFNYAAPEWRSLAEENRRSKHLVMSCCGRSVVVKTSHLGTHFFAHSAEAQTSCARESEEHLLAKDLVARAVVMAGWRAQTEANLESRLKADVLAIDGTRRVAFEIQWSRQTAVETMRRQRLYHAAGVRALWLFRQADYPMEQAVPAFRLRRRNGERGFDVWVWSEKKDWRRRERVASQEVELQTFVRGALSGKLKWKAGEGLTVPVLAHVAKDVCINGHHTRSLVEFTLDVSRVLPEHANLPLSMDEVGYACPELLRSGKATALLKKHGLRIHFGVSNVSRQKWNPEYEPYALPCCSVCGELVGCQLDGTEQKPEQDFALSLALSPSLVKRLPRLDADLARWWFGDRQTDVKGTRKQHARSSEPHRFLAYDH